MVGRHAKHGPFFVNKPPTRKRSSLWKLPLNTNTTAWPVHHPSEVYDLQNTRSQSICAYRLLFTQSHASATPMVVFLQSTSNTSFLLPAAARPIPRPWLDKAGVSLLYLATLAQLTPRRDLLPFLLASLLEP